MISFIYGTNGSGKTTAVLNSLLEDTKNGIHSFLIVPDQEALQFERLTLASFSASSQLNLEILGFSRLYNRVCREFGGLSYSYITKPVRSMLMWKTLHELSGTFEGYKNMRADVSMADTMLSSINEFKANGITPASLEIAAKKLPCDSPLAMRLNDISSVYSWFDSMVYEKYSDSADDLARLRDILYEHDFFAGSHVYFDSFSSFTAVQHQIIERIFKTAENITVTIPLSSEAEKGISADSIKKSLKKLKNSANKYGGAKEIFLGPNLRASSPCLAYLSKNLWNLGSLEDNAPRYDGSIVCEVCDNPYSEAEAVCAHIRKLLQGGARCKDIVIIARDAEKYRGIIDVALKRSDIPFFFSQKSDLCSMPAVKFILSALRIKKYNWQKRDVISYLKTGLCDVSAREANLFEEYVNTWNINGSRFTAESPWTMNPDGFVERLSERGKDILDCANSVKARLVLPLEKYFICLDAANDISDMCRATYEYLKESNLEDKLLSLAQRAAEQSDAKKANELSRIYSIILEALANIAEALEGDSADTEEFIQILRNIFDKTEIASIPTSIDEITVGSASMLRTANPKYTFVIGLCEGEFPATVSDNGLLSSNDRNTLIDLGIELSDDADTRSSDELMFVQRAFSSPSKQLFLFTHEHDINGTAHFPSLAFNRVLSLFSIKPHKYRMADFDYLIPAPKNAVSLFRSIESEAKKESLKNALKEYVGSFAEYAKIPTNSEECKVSEQLVAQATSTSMRFSPSSFERYAKCPFNYFCSNVLNLRENVNSKFNANDMGSFIHYILEELIKYSIPSDLNEPIPEDEEIIKRTDEAVAEYIKKICPDEMICSKRLSHLYWRLRTLSLLLIKNTVKEFSASEFRPMFFEFRTDGRGQNPAPLVFSLGDGTQVSFSGIVDRVDVYKKDDRVYIRVVDYKTGVKTFSSEDIEHGINLQMLIYLFTLCRNKSEQFRKSIGIEEGKDALPAGIVYLSAAVPYIEAEDYEAADKILEQAENQLVRSGLLLNDDEILHAMNNTLDSRFIPGINAKSKKGALVTSEEFNDVYKKLEETVIKIASEIRSGNADPTPLDYNDSPCEYCKSKPICRRAKK